MINEASAADTSVEQLVALNIADCQFKDNIFTGDESALIYTKKILTRVFRSVFMNNGRYTENVFERERTNYNPKFVTSSLFSFRSYSFADFQTYGCIKLYGEESLGKNRTHEFVSNTFKFNFADQGVAYAFEALDNQEVYMAGNTYEFLFGGDEGGILSWENNREKATILMENEKAQFIYARNYGGGLRIKPIIKQ